MVESVCVEVGATAGSALFSKGAISEHLKLVHYPQKSIDSYLRCGEGTGLYMTADCECRVKNFEISHRCNLRICPRCADSRKKRIRRQYLPFLEGLPNNRGRYGLLFLTISPKNYDSYAEGLRTIKQNFKKFMRSKYIRDRVKGGFYVIEAKNVNDKGEANGWNIHVHAVIYSRKLDNKLRGHCNDCHQNYIKFDYHGNKRYCANRSCNSLNVTSKRDSHLVRLYKQSSGEQCNIQIQTLNSASFSLNYMLKYVGANKDDFATLGDAAAYVAGNRKQKLISAFGSFFNHKFVKVPHICKCCDSEIHYTIEWELQSVFADFDHVERMSKPPNLELALA